MKSESEKLKSRTSLSMNDADWKKVKKAAGIVRVPMSAFIRDQLAASAQVIINGVERTTAKKERVG